MPETTNCTRCGVPIQPPTARRTGGLCMPCSKEPREQSNESWIIEEGDRLIRKQTREGQASLTPWEVLVDCLWIADYGMQNAGDLDAAVDIRADFQLKAQCAATALGLPLALRAFSMTQAELQRAYFNLFEALCDEIRSAKPIQ